MLQGAEILTVFVAGQDGNEVTSFQSPSLWEDVTGHVKRVRCGGRELGVPNHATECVSGQIR
jgi:hypothetical protein